MEVTEEQFYGATKTAWGMYKQKMGLARSTSSKACYAFGVGDTWMLLMIERLMVLLNALESKRSHVRDIAEAMLFLEQRWEGSATHCLSRGQDAQRGRSGLWIGDIRRFMTEYAIEVRGGKGLSQLRENDFCIADYADSEHRGYVAAGLWCLERWRVSEFINNTGEVAVEWVTGELQSRIRDEIGYDTEEERSRAGMHFSCRVCDQSCAAGGTTRQVVQAVCQN